MSFTLTYFFDFKSVSGRKYSINNIFLKRCIIFIIEICLQGRFPAARNTNLISIRTVDSESDNLNSVQKSTEDECPKLILPQDRYHKVEECKETIKEAPSNKFDRYDNSDNSDSEDNSDTDVKKNDREDSLER